MYNRTYCAWDIRWGRNLKRRKVGKVWSSTERQECICWAHHIMKGRALNPLIPFVSPLGFLSFSNMVDLHDHPPKSRDSTSSSLHISYGSLHSWDCLATLPLSEESLETGVWEASSSGWKVVISSRTSCWTATLKLILSSICCPQL